MVGRQGEKDGPWVGEFRVRQRKARRLGRVTYKAGHGKEGRVG